MVIGIVFVAGFFTSTSIDVWLGLTVIFDNEISTEAGPSASREIWFVLIYTTDGEFMLNTRTKSLPRLNNGISFRGFLLVFLKASTCAACVKLISSPFLSAFSVLFSVSSKSCSVSLIMSSHNGSEMFICRSLVIRKWMGTWPKSGWVAAKKKIRSRCFILISSTLSQLQSMHAAAHSF